MPSRRNSSSGSYLLRWPGGWKLQMGTITKFPTVTKSPVLLVSHVCMPDAQTKPLTMSSNPQSMLLGICSSCTVLPCLQ